MSTDYQPPSDTSRHDTISRIVHASKEALLTSLEDQYFTIDTAFMGADPTAVGLWFWLETSLHRLLELSTEAAMESHPYRFHRLFLVPRPDDLKNPWLRQQLRSAIKSILHCHMWHGVVAYVIFLPARNTRDSRRLASLDFGSLGPRLVFKTPGFHMEDYSGMQRLEGAAARTIFKEAFSLLTEGDIKNHHWLYYDDESFETRRRKRDSQWQSIRRFLYSLQSARCSGPDCNRTVPLRRDWHADHVISIAAPGGSNVLLNLRGLCGDCNRHKHAMDTREFPFDLAYRMIPPEFASSSIKNSEFGNGPPPWAGRVRRRPTNSLLRFWNSIR